MMTPTDAYALAIALAPELAGRLDVIRHHPNTLGETPTGCLAWCCAGRHLGVRDELRRLGRWHGFWPSMIVFVGEPAIGPLVHELAHVLPARPVVSDDAGEPTEHDQAFQAAQLRQWVAPTDPQDRFPWAGHDVRFVRRAVHLAERARRLGIDVAPRDLNVAGDRYGLSHVTDYADRFASEPYMSTHRTFDEIDQLPFPDPVLRLFANDVRLWAVGSLIGG